jgi:FkbM family methyltransferase
MRGGPPSISSSGRPPAIGRVVARNRRSFVVRKLAGLCRRYMSWAANVNYDLETNGEAFVLAVLSRFRPTLLFDAGANVGDWTEAALAICPTARVHAFEISPPTFAKLLARFGNSERAVCRNIGLSDYGGSIRIRHYDGIEALTTSTAYPHPFPYREIDAEVTTGTMYAEANGIEHVDILKVDVEGMEESVLRGFDPLFQKGAVDLVQFEYGRISIMNRFLLRDFYTFFAQRGFRVGKIYPNHVDFREYEMDDEDFLGPNYLACQTKKAEYLKAFQGIE